MIENRVISGLRVDGLTDDCTHGSGGDIAGKGLYRAKTMHSSFPCVFVSVGVSLPLIPGGDLMTVEKRSVSFYHFCRSPLFYASKCCRLLRPAIRTKRARKRISQFEGSYSSRPTKLLCLDKTHVDTLRRLVTTLQLE